MVLRSGHRGRWLLFLRVRCKSYGRMTRYSDTVERDEILRAFEQEGLEYVLIGAAAMGFHGLVRATEDPDLFIRSTPENVERLKRAFPSASTRPVTPASLSKVADLAGGVTSTVPLVTGAAPTRPRLWLAVNWKTDATPATDC